MQPSFSGLFVTCAYLPVEKERINGMICKQDFIIIINSFKKWDAVWFYFNYYSGFSARQKPTI